MRIYSIKLSLTPYPPSVMIIEKPLYFELFCPHVYRLVVSFLAPVKREKFANSEKKLKTRVTINFSDYKILLFTNILLIYHIF